LWDPSLDIASACAFTVCLGLVVDDTVHFLTRFQQERQRGRNMHRAAGPPTKCELSLGHH
jgi:predicted RND superfamily exporter protein